MSAPQMLRDMVRDAFGVTQDLVVPEAQHTVAVCFHGCGSLRVGVFIMLAAISLDNKLCAMACEVDDVLADRNLPPEARLRECLAQ